MGRVKSKPSEKAGYLCGTDAAWLAYHLSVRGRAEGVVYYRKHYNTPFREFPADGPIFGCVLDGQDIRLRMAGVWMGHASLTPAAAWEQFGDRIGVPSLSAWWDQAGRVLGACEDEVFSWVEIGAVRYFDPGPSLAGVPLTPQGGEPRAIGPQTFQAGRRLDRAEVRQLAVLLPVV